jgi:excisionase family DNA binding protein
MARPQVECDPLLTPGEVAEMFGVDTATVTRWARSGRLPAVRTLGGHRRFREQDVREWLREYRPFRPAM